MPYTNFNLPTFADGTPVNRSDLRKLVMAIMRTSGDFANQYVQTGTGQLAKEYQVEMFPAYIASTYVDPKTPSSPSARYNMVRSITTEGQNPNAIWTSYQDGVPGIKQNFVATNYAELSPTGAATGNRLQAKQQVLVFAVWNRSVVSGSSVDSVSTKFYLFYFAPPSPTVTVRLGVTSTDPSGIYGYTYATPSYIQTGTPTTVTSGVITTFTDGQRCVVVNGNEINYYAPGPVKTLHMLPTQFTGGQLPSSGTAYVYYQGEIIGTYTDSNGNVVPQVLINVEPSREVTLSATGGTSNGYYSNGQLCAATYTYTVTHKETGTQLWTGATPDCNRPNGVLTGPATRGGFGVAPTGLLSLVWTDEQLDASVFCPCNIPCPTDCSSCPSTLALAISGLPAGTDCGNALNGQSFTITRSACMWTYMGTVSGGTISITLACSAGTWTTTIVCTSVNGTADNETWAVVMPNKGTCPQTGTFMGTTQSVGSPSCDGSTITITLT